MLKPAARPVFDLSWRLVAIASALYAVIWLTNGAWGGLVFADGTSTWKDGLTINIALRNLVVGAGLAAASQLAFGMAGDGNTVSAFWRVVRYITAAVLVVAAAYGIWVANLFSGA